MPPSKWTPTTNPMMLRRMGKLQEELGELAAVAARCIIQGIDEIDPGSGKTNRDRLQNELADVMAQCEVTIEALGLDAAFIDDRSLDKRRQMREWEAMLPPANTPEVGPVFVVKHMGMSYGEGREHTTVLVGHSLCHRALAPGAKLYEEPPAVYITPPHPPAHTVAEPGQLVMLCGQHDREPCPDDPLQRCEACPRRSQTNAGAA